MLKTVKSKVMAGTAALVLVTGASVAFGASDAGANLKTWYNSQFNQAGQTIANSVATDLNGKVDGLATEYVGLKTSATTSINDTKDAETTAKSTAITAEAQEYIDSINAQKLVISNNLAGQFAALESYAEGLINQAGTAALTAAKSDLKTHTESKGTTALANLNTDLNTATETAKTNLTAAISTAKAELQAQLATETTTTTADIIAKIDAKIIELRAQITAEKDRLVGIQKGLVTAKAAELESSAKSQLQGIVNGI